MKAFERWAREHPEHGSTIGFRLNALNSPWLNWKIDIVDEYKEALRARDLGDDSLMRVFINSRLARPYRMQGKRVEVDLYHERREVYPCHKAGAEIPEGVVLLTAAVDVHDDRLIYDIVGWGAGRESWGIETGEFRGDPRVASSGVWDQIDLPHLQACLPLRRWEVDPRAPDGRRLRRARHHRRLQIHQGAATARLLDQRRRGHR